MDLMFYEKTQKLIFESTWQIQIFPLISELVIFLTGDSLTSFKIWNHLYNLRKRRKFPWKSITFSKVADFTLQLY